MKTNTRPIEWERYLVLIRGLGQAAAENGWDKPKKKAARAELTRLLSAAGYDLAKFPFEQVVAGGDYVLTNNDRPPKRGQAATPAKSTAPSSLYDARRGIVTLGQYGQWSFKPARDRKFVLYKMDGSGKYADIHGNVYDRTNNIIDHIDTQSIGFWKTLIKIFNKLADVNDFWQEHAKIPPKNIPYNVPRVPSAVSKGLEGAQDYNVIRDAAKKAIQNAPPSVTGDFDETVAEDLRYEPIHQGRKQLPDVVKLLLYLSKKLGTTR